MPKSVKTSSGQGRPKLREIMSTATRGKKVAPIDTAPERALATARRVFEIEAAGLAEAARAMDTRFVEAVELLASVAGRVIVTGMGKSGHIAHKIASTLASTGTPAFFVHPAEASHGDLGMVTKDDAVIAISNSGTTAELADLIAHTRRFKVPLVAITSGAKSQLGEQADVLLALPRAPEACPMGLAPTTSTTMTLALGDAIAVALLERQGFTSDDFQLLHPGGQLGRRLLKVGDIMHTGKELPVAAPDEVMSDVLITMTAKHFGCVGVVKGDKLAGVITDGDLRRHMAPGLLEAKAKTVMTKSPVTVRSSQLAAEAIAIMNERAITALFVVDSGKLTGILHIHDILHSGVA